jgi:hypothetical protein
MIPRIIHQLWVDESVPPAYGHWQRSWQKMHPDFEYRFWTNVDIERFIDDECPEWSALFYGYTENICRVDLARYLILQRFGGLYVDLDFECVRPHHALLDKHSLIFGLEPHSHAMLPKSTAAGIKAIVCNAWIASVPGHPFWSHFLQHLERTSSHSDVLEITGPFAITRSLSSYCGEGVSVVPASYLYPVDKQACWTGDIQDLEFFETATRQALAVHHWVGSWFRDQQHLRILPLPRAKLTLPSLKVPESTPSPLSVTNQSVSEITISCLMVTRGDRHRLRHSIKGFLAQTHRKSELVIVTDERASRLRMVQAEYPSQNIRWVFVEPNSLTLGELRNLCIDNAKGDYVVQWDDDDLHDPSRLQHQLGAILAAKAHATMLARWTVWWPKLRRLFISSRRTWEGSLMCERRLMPRYPAMKKGEDTPVIEAVMGSMKVVMLDAPRLYVYVVHGQNTWHDEHFQEIYKRASVDFSGPKYSRVLREVSRRVDVEGYFPKQ